MNSSVVTRNRGTHIFDVIRAKQISGGYLGENPGRDYYVNNISGSDSMNGRSWKRAYNEIAAAVTASEAYRALKASTNEYIRNRIFVQGTGTAYAALTALPNYCDIIGVGAPAHGNGTGIARIGASGADGIAGAARGLGLYNLQFISGGAFYCADFTNLLRSAIEDCAFMAGTDGQLGGVRFSTSSGGNRILRNHWGSIVAHSNFVTGMLISGPGFDHNRIEENYIQGISKGVFVEDTVTGGGWTVFKENVIGDINGEGCTLGIDDDLAASGEWVATAIVYAGNHIIATTNATLVTGADTRFVGNMSGHAYAAATAS